MDSKVAMDVTDGNGLIYEIIWKKTGYVESHTVVRRAKPNTNYTVTPAGKKSIPNTWHWKTS